MNDEQQKLLKIFIDQVESGLPKYSIQNDTIENINIINNTDDYTQEYLINQIMETLTPVSQISTKKAIVKSLLTFDIYQSIKDKYDEIVEAIEKNG